MNNHKESILKIAAIQVRHLQEAFVEIGNNYPFTESFVVNISKDNLRILDTLINRFIKLQDLLGAKIMDICLLQESEPIVGLSVLDKVNKLEKLQIVANS